MTTKTIRSMRNDWLAKMLSKDLFPTDRAFIKKEVDRRAKKQKRV